MPTAAIEPPQGLANATNQPHPSLRRAVYVHVSDLTSGAYNIDHARLEEELARVKKDRENPPVASAPSLGVPTELDTSVSQKRLQPPRGGFNLCVLVGKVQVVVDKSRVDGSRVRLAEVEVGDETGTVSLRARDDQIDTLKEVSERSGAVVLRNCTLELYQGKHIRLAVTKWGKLSTYPDQVASTPPAPSKMNQDRNFSLIDLSLVASEMVTDQFRQKMPSADGQGGNASSNRHHSFQSGQSMGRGGGGGGNRGRRSSQRGKPAVAPNPVMPVHYPERTMSSPMRYQGGMHGYAGGYGDVMDQSYGSYPHRQRQQEQMMMHQQFEMQQRHMQHSMYHTPAERSSVLQSPSPMLAPGIPNAASERPMPLLGSNPNPFLMPIAGDQTSSHPHQGQSTPTQLASSRSESPMTPGKMNPQAATFDPSKPSNK